MEIGRLAEMDKAQVSHVEKLQKVPEVDLKNKVDPDEQYKKHITNKTTVDHNEVILDNVQFGFNKKSQDFFVKVVRGDIEYKYPSEDMMKLKAYLREAIDNIDAQMQE